MPHKAGFVSIIGKPNVGKSTLMNQLVGEKLSIITSKAQTTRHRIMGILSGDDFQVVYSDGIVAQAAGAGGLGRLNHGWRDWGLPDIAW